MQITTHALWTTLHGMGFGALYLLGFTGLYVELARSTSPSAPPQNIRLVNAYLAVMVVFAWAAVLSGAYIVYPWYRVALPPGAVNLALYPQRLLLSNPATSGWHTLGMEWKEHVAWFCPISITMAAGVSLRYGAALKDHLPLRRAVLAFVLVSFVSAGIAGFFGAMINKAAPITGGPTVQITHGASR